MTGMSNMKDMPMNGVDNSDAGAHVMHSMEGDMDMGAHMKMTSLRPTKPGDAERSQRVVEAARRASEKYKDYHAALADGFQIVLPNIPQKMYHCTNHGYAAEAEPRWLADVDPLTKAQAHRRDVHGTETFYGRPIGRTHPAECGAVARACEFLRPAEGSHRRTIQAPSGVRLGIDHHSGSL